MCVEGEPRTFHDELTYANVGENIEKGISMFEATKDNYCDEYSPWSYNLLGGSSISKAILEDDDGQDLNNSMVDDLVAKILDDDCITHNDIFTSQCNGTMQQYQVATSSIASDCKIKIDTNAYLANTNDFHNYPFTRVENNLLGINEKNDQEYRNIYNGLNSLNLNMCMGQENHDKNNSFTNNYINSVKRTVYVSDNNIHRLEQQYPAQIDNEGSFTSRRNSYVPLSNNGLITTTNGLNYNLQSINWSDTMLSTECVKDLFGHYSQIQSCNNTDFNLNVAQNLALDSSDNGVLNEMRSHCTIPSNSHSNPVLNIHESYNATANGQSYCSNSNVTNLSIDSSFLSNSPIQRFSPVESSLQNCFTNSFQHNKYEEQQNSRTNKLDDVAALAAEQTYKRLVNHYPNLSEQQFISNNDLDKNNGRLLIDQGLDSAFLKMLSSNSTSITGNAKSREKQVFSTIGYSHNIASASVVSHEAKQLEQLKFNYQNANDCQQFIVNNPDALKIIQHKNSQTSFKNNHKRYTNNSSLYKMKTAYEISNSIDFPFTLLQQQQQHFNSNSNNGIDNDILNHLIKQQEQQQPIKSISSISPATDVLFKAGFLQNTNSGIFPSQPVISIPMTVPPPISIFEANLGMRNANSVRRSGSSKILYSRLEQTYEQFKQLEKERKKCEAGLAAHFPGKKVTSANNIPIPRLQGSPSRVDKLIIDHFREHARVITLIAKMERLRGAEMNPRVHKAMEYWCDAIKFVQERRKQEIANVNKRQKENIHCISIHDDNSFPDIVALADSIYTLTKASRYARTAMYNAMQSTLLYNRDIETKIVDTSQDVVMMLHFRENNISEIKSTTISVYQRKVKVAPPVNEEIADRT